MKKFTSRLASLFLLLAVVQACNEPLLQEGPVNSPELKSAGKSIKSYIVLIEDQELDTELQKLKGYEKKKQAVKSTASNILKRAKVSDAQVIRTYGTAVKGFSVKMPPGQLKKLQEDIAVKFIEEDKNIALINPAKKPDNPGGGKPDKGGGGDDPAPSQAVPWGINRVNGAISGNGNRAWIIDSGIDLDHEDLNVNTTLSVSFLGGKQGSSPDDQNGHGTHVAGTIAAIDNTIGVVGVAAGAEVVAVRVLDRRGSGSVSGVIEGVDYVAAKASRSDVANMSLGGGISSALDEAVLNASAVCPFVLAAGNEGENANYHSPARVNGNAVYTISAMRQGDTWASFSNYGPAVDFCAPGVAILSCYKNGGYTTLNGTSMAAPHVAGILLLGNISTDGAVSGDPDENNDPIAVH